jgi:hypothetical protein
MSVTPGPPATTRFIESLLGKEVYVKLDRDWSVQGRLSCIEESGVVLERVGIPPIFVRFDHVGTIEEAQ